MTDSLGDRMKIYYEDVTRHYLPRRTHTIIRLDGKSFHTYTKKLVRPFDAGLIEDMQKTTIRLCENIQGAVLGYTQSDEISLVLCDYKEKETESFFKGNIQKICSVSASMATAFFNAFRQARNFEGGPAFFDARVFTIPEKVEVLNYLIWRQKDATRNSIQMAAQSVYSHKELNKKKWSDLNEMLFQKGINFNDYSSSEKRGSLIVKEYFEGEAYDKRKQENVIVTRSRWIVEPDTPLFTAQENRDLFERYLYSQI